MHLIHKYFWTHTGYNFRYKYYGIFHNFVKNKGFEEGICKCGKRKTRIRHSKAMILDKNKPFPQTANISTNIPPEGEW